MPSNKLAICPCCRPAFPLKTAGTGTPANPATYRCVFSQKCSCKKNSTNTHARCPTQQQRCNFRVSRCTCTCVTTSLFASLINPEQQGSMFKVYLKSHQHAHRGKSTWNSFPDESIHRPALTKQPRPGELCDSPRSTTCPDLSRLGHQLACAQCERSQHPRGAVRGPQW